MRTSEFIDTMLDPCSRITYDDIFAVIEECSAARMPVFINSIERVCGQNMIWQYVADNTTKQEEGGYGCDIPDSGLKHFSRLYNGDQSHAHIIFDRACYLLGRLRQLQGEPSEPPQFKINLTDERREKLFSKLIDGGYIAKDTDKDSFLWAFGGENPPAIFHKIRWIKLQADQHGQNKGKMNKTAIIDLLHILNVKYVELTNRSKYNAIFLIGDKPPKMTTHNFQAAAGRNYRGECYVELRGIVGDI